MKTKLLFVLFAFAVSGSTIGQVCPPGGCPPYLPPVAQEQVQEVSVLDWYKQLTYASGITKTPELDAEAAKYKYRAVRITVNGSCGSGSLVGRDANNCWVCTNSHVAGNVPGRVVNCEAALFDNSGTEKFQATVIEGAYSSRDTTDWSILKMDAKHLKGFEPIRMSIKMPDHSKPFFTWGCPRCEVPSGQVMRTVVSTGPVWKWLPNSIGGQSGSGVFQRGFQFGLLTWSYGGGSTGSVGAGQYTADIYRQSRNQTSDSAPRPEGLVPVCENPTDDLIEGYTHMAGEKRLCEIGNFQDPDQFIESGHCIDGFVRQAGVGDYPIWGDPDAQPTDPVDPTDPICPPTGLTPEQKAKLESAKKLINEVLK